MITCSFPGKHGDLLWALPTVRAISEAAGEPVDLVISPRIGRIAALIEPQPYIHHVIVDSLWATQDTAPITPRASVSRPNAIHLGYEGWPKLSLPWDIYSRVPAGVAVAPLDLDRPWITVARMRPFGGGEIVVGWSDEYFELKAGVTQLLTPSGDRPGWDLCVICSDHSRWLQEYRHDGDSPLACDWILAAELIASARVFLGCCSAPHVLAVAVGTPAVVMEPAEARWNPIFWPLGQDGPRVRLVKGGDGKPTFDARHVDDAIRKMLE